MNLEETIQNWDLLGEREPLWAILNDKSRKERGWEVKEFFETGQREVAELFTNLVSLGAKPRRRAALDFGCGVGRLTQALVPYFDRVIGVDAAGSMIRLAERYNRFPDHCAYLLNTAPDLKALFPDRSFDFIYSKITLQHMEPQYAKLYLKEFIRILAPAGVLVFQIPSERIVSSSPPKSGLIRRIKILLPIWLLNRYQKLRYGKRPRIEMYGIPKEEVISLLASLGATDAAVRRDRSAGKDWISWEYCAQAR